MYMVTGWAVKWYTDSLSLSQWLEGESVGGRCLQIESGEDATLLKCEMRQACRAIRPREQTEDETSRVESIWVGEERTKCDDVEVMSACGCECRSTSVGWG